MLGEVRVVVGVLVIDVRAIIVFVPFQQHAVNLGSTLAIYQSKLIHISAAKRDILISC